MPSSFSLIRTNTDHYERCHEILGLPEDVHWSSISVQFGNEDVGTVTLVLLPTGEQVQALAELAVLPTGDDCIQPPRVDEGLIGRRHQIHGSVCGCLDLSAECCVESCPCHT